MRNQCAIKGIVGSDVNADAQTIFDELIKMGVLPTLLTIAFVFMENCKKKMREDRSWIEDSVKILRLLSWAGDNIGAIKGNGANGEINGFEEIDGLEKLFKSINGDPAAKITIDEMKAQGEVIGTLIGAIEMMHLSADEVRAGNEGIEESDVSPKLLALIEWELKEIRGIVLDSPQEQKAA